MMKNTIVDVKLIPKEWPGSVFEVSLGKAGSTVKIGAENCRPFLHFEGKMLNAPKIALEVWDLEPREWSWELKRPFGNALKNPLDWAKKCVYDFGIEILCIRLVGTHPALANKNLSETAKLLQEITKSVAVPLVVIGSGHIQKDRFILPEVARVLQGENCIIGMLQNTNSKALIESAQEYGHSIIVETPPDLNIPQRINKSLQKIGFPLDKIVIHYFSRNDSEAEDIFSVMEEARLKALEKNQYLAQPMIAFAGAESWLPLAQDRTAALQNIFSKGVFREVLLAISYLQAGADLLILNHPSSALRVKNIIDDLMSQGVF